jgi:hypothetical protein
MITLFFRTVHSHRPDESVWQSRQEEENCLSGFNLNGSDNSKKLGHFKTKKIPFVLLKRPSVSGTCAKK